jgi:GH24 family phage-related lysozyme (muramidase)
VIGDTGRFSEPPAEVIFVEAGLRRCLAYAGILQAVCGRPVKQHFQKVTVEIAAICFIGGRFCFSGLQQLKNQQDVRQAAEHAVIIRDQLVKKSSPANRQS